jgi:predicted nucleotidyltransferase
VTDVRREDALRILGEHREEIAARGVRTLSIFGSVARDEAGPDSDVDIIVEVNRPFGYFELFDLEQYLAQLLGRRVDLFTPNSVHPLIRTIVIEQAVRVE